MGRAVVMADLMADWCDVHIVAFGGRVWEPLAADTRIELLASPRTNMDLPGSVRNLARAVERDEVLVAIKPRALSYGLSCVVRQHRPLILDIDDLEHRFVRRRMSLVRQLVTPDHEPVTRLLERWRTRAAAVTVASEGLRRRYGGTWIPHVRDRRDFARIGAQQRDSIRNENELQGSFVVGFVGTMRRHKGLHVAARAVSLLPPEWMLLVVGDGDRAYAAEIAADAGSRARFVPPVPLDRVSGYLAACDIVVIPQTASPEAMFQSPAKLLDAMAAGAAIVASDVGDARTILGDAGILVPPDNVAALRDALFALRDPALRLRLGKAAWERHQRMFDLQHWARVLRNVVAGVAAPPSITSSDR